MVIHSCSFLQDTFVLIVVNDYCVFIIIVSLVVARGSCIMSSRQSSRADLGGIPEGDPIENKVCLFLLFLCLYICCFALVLFCFKFALRFVDEMIHSVSVSHLFQFLLVFF